MARWDKSRQPITSEELAVSNAFEIAALLATGERVSDGGTKTMEAM